MAFPLLLGTASLLAGAIAAVVGFGIGSILTPVFAVDVGMKLAVAAAAIPHCVGSAQRFWILRRHVDRRVLLNFGVASALSGLAGALLHARASSRALTVCFGALLILASASEFTGWMSRVRWGKRAAWIAGAVSGLSGGLVGNQGGIRSAAMLGFKVPKESFVATATAIALLVDVARVPVYLATEGRELGSIAPLLWLSVACTVLGTAFGARVLRRVPELAFRRVVAVLLMALGAYLLIRAVLPTPGSGLPG